MCEGVNFPGSSRICDKITQKYLRCGNINKHGSSLSELKFLWLFVNQVSGLYVRCPLGCRFPDHRDLALLITALTVPHRVRYTAGVCQQSVERTDECGFFSLILRKPLSVCPFSLTGLKQLYSTHAYSFPLSVSQDEFLMCDLHSILCILFLGIQKF